MNDQTIHILSADLANKIAAGEVVQRPASAVKELIENAVDAHATRIEVIVAEAGRTLIQVVDNGDGMSETDATFAFRRHATSKIRDASDLEAIRTLGFRGEALASIAAVARVELRSRRETDDIGTVVTSLEGEKVSMKKDATPKGTSVSVRNLFFNTPARRNFLKTNRTELRNIVDTVTRAAMIHPEIAWRLDSDGETLVDVEPQDQLERGAALLGKQVGKALLPCEETTEVISIKGFIARPSFARKSRAEQYIYLNKRPISSRMIAHAVFQAYEHLLIHGGYPLFALDLTVDPTHVDVNVHPSKQEVKFDDESSIYRMVLSVVRKTLAAHALVPEVSVRDGNAVESGSETLPPFIQQQHPSSSAPIFRFQKDAGPHDEPVTGGSSILRMKPPTDSSQTSVKQAEADGTMEHRRIENADSQDAHPLWQIQNKYIVSQVRTGLVIVDQHVAHERILYERVLANFDDSLPATQQLLFPETLELSPVDYALVVELEDPLKQLGFDIRLFGKNTVIIEGLPADVKVGNEKRILQDVLEDYKKNTEGTTVEVRDKLAKSYACKAAIKAGDPLNHEEMKVLIEQLFLTRMPYVCPHGRPVVIRIPIDELDRRFGRT
jgi:DNA mismatch repair protein MutL